MENSGKRLAKTQITEGEWRCCFDSEGHGQQNNFAAVAALIESRVHYGTVRCLWYTLTLESPWGGGTAVVQGKQLQSQFVFVSHFYVPCCYAFDAIIK